MQYKVLVLDENSRQMTMPVAKAIYQLLNDGATVIGPKPLANPSLAGKDDQYQTLINKIWGGNETDKK